MPKNPRHVLRRPNAGNARGALALAATAAASALLLVSIGAPYTAALATPETEFPHYPVSVAAAQHVEVGGEAESAVANRDVFTTQDPPPIMQAATAASTGSDPASAQAYAKQALAAKGMGDDQFECLVQLWTRESGWRIDAENASSGAYGIPQALPGDKMATAGGDWQTNAVTQINWGLGYVLGRYSTPCGAWGHETSAGWY
jgi:hypothetical protein